MHAFTGSFLFIILTFHYNVLSSLRNFPRSDYSVSYCCNHCPLRCGRKSKGANVSREMWRLDAANRACSSPLSLSFSACSGDALALGGAEWATLYCACPADEVLIVRRVRMLDEQKRFVASCFVGVREPHITFELEESSSISVPPRFCAYSSHQLYDSVCSSPTGEAYSRSPLHARYHNC